MNIQALFIFDISTILMMIVLAFLSKRLGEALKIKPYFKILYITSFFIFAASATDFMAGLFSIRYLVLVSLSVRLIAGVTAFIICMIYWKWLFSAFKH